MHTRTLVCGVFEFADRGVLAGLSNNGEGNLPVLLGISLPSRLVLPLLIFAVCPRAGLSNPSLAVETSVVTLLETMTCNDNTILVLFDAFSFEFVCAAVLIVLCAADHTAG